MHNHNLPILNIREDKNIGVYVEGLSQYQVRNS